MRFGIMNRADEIMPPLLEARDDERRPLAAHEPNLEGRNDEGPPGRVCADDVKGSADLAKFVNQAVVFGQTEVQLDIVAST